MSSKLGLNAVVAVLASAAVLALPVAATADVHKHGAVSDARRLSLNQGEKWATDEPLRKGMGEIRALVEAQHAAIHKNTLKPADYAALGAKIETQVGSIVQDCKLPPEADANLHIVLEEMLEGVEAMKGEAKKSPAAGAGRVVAALNEYGKYFDHPGWKRL